MKNENVVRILLEDTQSLSYNTSWDFLLLFFEKKTRRKVFTQKTGSFVEQQFILVDRMRRFFVFVYRKFMENLKI